MISLKDFLLTPATSPPAPLLMKERGDSAAEGYIKFLLLHKEKVRMRYVERNSRGAR